MSMIGMLRGQIVRKTAGYIILDVQGVGYKVFGPPEVLLSEEKELVLHTYLAVRETALDLYGFKTEADADFFQELLSVSGVGPKSALQIISAAPARVLRTTIARGDAGELHKVYGIGKKVSEKLVLELKKSCEEYAQADPLTQEPTDSDVLEALVALGYKTDEARAVLHQLPSDLDGVQEKIREALKRLG